MNVPIQCIDRNQAFALLQLCYRSVVFLVDISSSMHVISYFRSPPRELVILLYLAHGRPLDVILDREFQENTQQYRDRVRVLTQLQLEL